MANPMQEFEMTDSEFVTAAEKEKVLRHWRKFLAGGCKQSQFTKALYEHLSLHCCFIAHFNIHGFYDAQFSTPERRTQFFKQFDKRNALPYGLIPSNMLGMTYWMEGEYEDINKAMVEIATDYIPFIRGKARRAACQRDLTEAIRLLDKWQVTERNARGALEQWAETGFEIETQD